MAETTDILTKTALLAEIDSLIVDNHDGANTPEKARDCWKDIVASVMGCYGGITADAATLNIQAAVAVASGYVQIANIGVAMPVSNVTANATAGTLTIGTNGAGDYEISVVGAFRRFEVTGGTGGFIAAGSPYEGTVPVGFLQLRLGAATNIATAAQKFGAQDDIHTITARAIRTLAANDVVSVWFGTLATLLEVKCMYLHVQLKRIG